MRFCTEHWALLQKAVQDRGLWHLVPLGGGEAMGKMKAELEDGVTKENFDPLMRCHNAIVGNSMEFLKERYLQNPLMIMADESDPETTWPTCPICALNWCHAEHNRICTKPGCDYPKEHDWVWMIDRAADEALAQWKAFEEAS